MKRIMKVMRDQTGASQIVEYLGIAVISVILSTALFLVAGDKFSDLNTNMKTQAVSIISTGF